MLFKLIFYLLVAIGIIVSFSLLIAFKQFNSTSTRQKYASLKYKNSTTFPFKFRPFIQSNVLQSHFDYILVLIKRDFILSWFQFNDLSFVHSVEKTIRHILKSIIERIESIDLKKLVIEKLGVILIAHISNQRKAEKASRSSKDDDVSKFYLNLHPATTSLDAELSHLRKISEKLLMNLAPPKEIKSKLVFCLFREIFTNKLILPITQLLSDPDFWNQTILLLIHHLEQNK